MSEALSGHNFFFDRETLHVQHTTIKICVFQEWLACRLMWEMEAQTEGKHRHRQRKNVVPPTAFGDIVRSGILVGVQ